MNYQYLLSMRKLLTGYVVNFNRRHRCHGHLFQNRYKSIVREPGYSGAEVAQYLGVTHPCVTRIVASGTKPPVEELIKEF